MRDSSPREGRKTLFSMGAAYALGTFNDNFFKSAAVLLAADAGLTHIQGRATLLFALPIVLFSVWAGRLADMLPKKDIVVWSKILEAAAMLGAVWSLLAMRWEGMVLVVCVMGLQTTFFSPALNGAIPENFPPHRVPRVNAVMKTATTLTILLGIALAGPVLELPPPALLEPFLPAGEEVFGKILVGGFSVLVALAGLLAASGMRRLPAPRGGDAPFPLRGPVDSVAHALECRKSDPPLYTALAGEAFFYGFSSFAVLCINNLGVRQLGFSKTLTGLFSVALMLGICAGALLAGRGGPEVRLRAAAAGGLMSLGLILAGLVRLVPQQAVPAWLFAVFTLTGLAGGMYLIPLASAIQVRPAATEKGKILGISNFASFSAVVLSGLLLEQTDAFDPADLLMLSGAAGLAFMLWLARRICIFSDPPRFHPLGFFLRRLLGLRYRIRIVGGENLPAAGPALFLPNHPALIDPVILYALLAGYRPRPLADERQMRGSLGRFAARITRAILIPDPLRDGAVARDAVPSGLNEAIDALRSGDSVLFYPAGHIMRFRGDTVGGNSGAAALLEAVPDVCAVLVRTSGLWGSSFSRAGHGGKAPDFGRSLLAGMGAVAANLIFFTPRREVTVEFARGADLPRGDKRALNRGLDDFHRGAEGPAFAVPRFFLRGAEPVPLPEPSGLESAAPGGGGVSPELRASVYAALREAAELPPDHPLDDSMTLNGDLGMDSLALMEFGLDFEQRYGRSVDDLETIVSVGDCLAAVAGLTTSGDAADPPPEAWFAPASPDALFAVPEGAPDILTAFSILARRAPHAVIGADRSGLKTRRDILTAALILARLFKKLPETRLGILLPSVPAVPAVWAAAQEAGKEPAFFNWTTGEAGLRRCIELAGVRRIVSSAALLERLEHAGLPVKKLPVEWLLLEDAIAGLNPLRKLQGALAARFGRGLSGRNAPETAAVLFTSGSESLPKAVPLTHANLLANARDLIRALRLKNGETVLAMLPPFHSFGLLAGLVMPLAAGLRAVYHPNPTEAARLNALVRDFKISLLAAAPTFLEAMLDRARGGMDLGSLRHAFIGAEKCPERVYRAFAQICPDAALCEGYGITECSPVVSVNRPGNVLPGSVGHVVDSLSTAVVREEDGGAARVRAGETGVLLVRGPSVFAGYLGPAPDPFVEFEGKRWYRTGDLVSMDETGRLTFRGRLKRFVKIGGEMISLPLIESILQEACGARPDAPADGPALAVEAADRDAAPEITLFTPLALNAPEANAILRRAGLSALHSVRRVVHVPAVPLLGTGKTDYRQLHGMLPAPAHELHGGGRE